MSLNRVDATHGFHATMTARPGKADELIDVLLASAPASNPNCLLFLVGRSAGDRNVVYVSEAWTTKEAHAENFAKDSSKTLVAKIGSLVTGNPEYRDEVAVGALLRP